MLAIAAHCEQVEAGVTDSPREIAARVLPLVDLTSLNDAQDDDIAALCAKAVTPHGHVAAVCSWSAFTAEMKQHLADKGPAVAVVVDFPEGTAGAAAAAQETKAAVAAGADEIDMVMDYRAWLAGQQEQARQGIAAVKAACGRTRLKVILETGRLRTADAIAEASRDAVAAGADFLKTSSGKTEVGATPEAAAAMLAVIRESGGDIGFKASGGVRNLEDAAAYLALADEIMGPDWVTPARFRIGASKLLDVVLAELDGG